MFSCEICEIFKDNFFTEHLQWLFLLITGYKTLTFPCLLFLSISISISQCFPLSSYIFCFYHSIVLLRQGWTQKLKRKMVNDRWRTSSANLTILAKIKKSTQQKRYSCNVLWCYILWSYSTVSLVIHDLLKVLTVFFMLILAVKSILSEKVHKVVQELTPQRVLKNFTKFQK